MTTAKPSLPADLKPGRFDPAWEDLFNRFADSLATADDEQELRTLLATSAEARRAYREFAALHSSLYWDYAAAANQGIPPGGASKAGPQAGASRGRWIATFLAGAILSGAAAAVAVAVFSPGDPPPPAVAQPLATVTNTRFTSQADPTAVLERGQPLEAGRFRFESGAVELTLRNGVQIVLEGPGELDLVGELEAFLHGGTAVVRMPKGMHGFRLNTPSTGVLDLGTEFAVKVGADFVTDVQVYDGAVLAAVRSGDKPGAFPRRIEAGQAARFALRSADEPLTLPYREDRFVRRLPFEKGVELPLPAWGPEAIAAALARQFGRPQAEAIVVARAAGPVSIDGRLDEWEHAPGVTASLDRDPGAAEWMDGRMMYDDEHLYIAARVGDPHPLASTVDPVIDADDGWRGGAVQVRLSTDRSLGWPVNVTSAQYFLYRNLEPTDEQRQAAFNPRLAHLTMWFHAATATPCLTIAHGMMTGDLNVNPSGFRGAYTRAADGRGYVMEYAIPWRLLNCETDPPRPGDDLAASWQVLYSDQWGRLFRTQIIEVRNPDESPRIYTWERATTWGRAEYR